MPKLTLNYQLNSLNDKISRSYDKQSSVNIHFYVFDY